MAKTSSARGKPSRAAANIATPTIVIQTPATAVKEADKESKVRRPKFRLDVDEKLPVALAQAFERQVEAAVAALGVSGEMANSIHDARRALKKARSVLRLARPALQGFYQDTNARLRDAGRVLSPLRDVVALVEMLSELSKESSSNEERAGLDRVRDAIERRHTQLLQEFAATHGAARTGDGLKVVLKKTKVWPGKQLDRAVLLDGVAKSVRQGRKAQARAEKDGRAESFHEWRKRAKDFRYQLSFLQPLWPEVLEGYAEGAKKLEQLLGEDHNLAVLKSLLPELQLSKKDVLVAASALTQRQNKLRRRALRAGQLVYAEGPKRWRQRLAQCWEVNT